MFMLPDETKVLQSTEAVVHSPGRQEGVADQVLPGHPAPVLKQHVQELRRRR